MDGVIFGSCDNLTLGCTYKCVLPNKGALAHSGVSMRLTQL